MKFKNISYKLSAIGILLIFTIIAIVISANLLLVRTIISDNIEYELKSYLMAIESLVEKESGNYYFQNELIDAERIAAEEIKNLIELPVDIVLFNHNFSAIIHSNSGSLNKINDVSASHFYKLLMTESTEGLYTNDLWINVNLSGQRSFVKYLTNIDLFILVSKPKGILYYEIGNYLSLLLMVLVFIFLVSSYLIFRINRKYVEPYSKIVDALNQNRYIKFSHKSQLSEPSFILKNIEMLSNQLDIYSKKLDITNKESRKIEKDLQIAKKLQSNILPKKIKAIEETGKIEISASAEAALEIGGDLYDYFMLGKSKVLFMLGDVSGKGIPAALYMIYTQTLMRSLATPGLSVSQIIGKLNNRLAEQNISDIFVTLFMGIIDLESGKVSFCNAAHNYPLLIRHQGSIEEISETHGIPLGIYNNRQYSYSEIQLQCNDQILIYTDGVVDTKDENGLNYTVDVLKYNLMGAWFLSPDDLQSKIKDSLKSFRGNMLPADDVSLMIIKYTGREAL